MMKTQTTMMGAVRHAKLNLGSLALEKNQFARSLAEMESEQFLKFVMTVILE